MNNYGESDSQRYEIPNNVSENLRLARMLERSLLDELEGISEYVYQSIIFEEVLPELSMMLEEIALDEMHHFEALGKLILKLGANPAFRARVQSGFINLSDNDERQNVASAKKVVAENIRKEKSGADTYRKLASMTSDTNVSELLLRIAEDEEMHIEEFQSFLKY
jgi:bacterioferritin